MGEEDTSDPRASWRTRPGAVIGIWSLGLIVLVAVVAAGVSLVRSAAPHSHATSSASDRAACQSVRSALARVGAAETSINSGASLGDTQLLSSLSSVTGSIDANQGRARGALALSLQAVKAAAVSVEATISSEYANGSSHPIGASPSTNTSLEEFSLASSKLNSVCSHQS